MASSRARPTSSIETSGYRSPISFRRETNRASMSTPRFEGHQDLSYRLNNSEFVNGDLTTGNPSSDATSPLYPLTLFNNANECLSPADQTELSRTPSFSVNDEMTFSTNRTMEKALPPTPSLNIQPASPIEGPNGSMFGMNHQMETNHSGIEIRVQPEQSAFYSLDGRAEMPHSNSPVPAHAVEQLHQNAASPPLSLGTPHSEQMGYIDIPIERPNTATSGDTFQQAQTLFQDFDGIHFQQPSTGTPSPIFEGAPFSVQANDEPSAAKYNASLPRASGLRFPPPANGMVYYPAPVPATLNLPQRLSMATPSNIDAKRRSMVIAALAPEARKSAIWLNRDGKDVPGEHKKSPSDLSAKAAATRLAALPPQLRASMFFETPTTLQDVIVQDRSVVATLEALLDASTTAPVSAFTDHPFAGRVGEVYRKGSRKIKHMSSMNDVKEENMGSRVSSFLGLRRKSLGSMDAPGDEAKKLERKGSRAFSMSAKVGLDDENDDEPQSKADLSDEEKRLEGIELPEDDILNNAGPPTTLVAELQLRKAAQKQRNRTAMKSFPNGMHATLLELDAVAQIQKKKRKKTRVTLAWEDPDMVKATQNKDDDEEDEDVPLGVLYAGKSGGTGMNKAKDGIITREPIGLIEQRELEDNEPLARRKARLQSRMPISRLDSQFFPLPSSRPMTPAGNSVVSAANTGDDDDIPGETLAERVKRLKERKQLDATIDEVRNNPMSKTFAEEMFGEINSERDLNGSRPSTSSSQVKEGEKIKIRVSPSPRRIPVKATGSAGSSPRSGTESGEETLGQRRARLQAKRFENGLRPGMHGKTSSQDNILGGKLPQHPLRASTSLADLIQDLDATNGTRRVSDKDFMAAQGSLLETSDNLRAARTAQIRSVNDKRMTAGLLSTVGDTGITARRTSSGFKGGMYNNGFGGVLPATDMSMGDMGMGYQIGSNMTMAYGMASVPNLLGMNMMGSTPNLLNSNMPINNMGMGMYMNPAMMSMNNLTAGMTNLKLKQFPQSNYQPQRQSDYMSGLHNFGHTPAQASRSVTPQPLADAFLDARGRERIDAWRQSVHMGEES